MKKGFLILVVFLVSSMATLYGKKIRHMIFAKPETKTVRFFVFAGTDYSAPLNKHEKAEVTLTISKFTGGKEEVLWSEVLNKASVRSFPGYAKPLYREVSLHNVFESNALVAYYQVSYYARKSKMSYMQGEVLSAGSQSDSLRISI